MVLYLYLRVGRRQLRAIEPYLREHHICIVHFESSVYQYAVLIWAL